MSWKQNIDIRLCSIDVLVILKFSNYNVSERKILITHKEEDASMNILGSDFITNFVLNKWISLIPQNPAQSVYIDNLPECTSWPLISVSKENGEERDDTSYVCGFNLS